MIKLLLLLTKQENATAGSAVSYYVIIHESRRGLFTEKVDSIFMVGKYFLPKLS